MTANALAGLFASGAAAWALGSLLKATALLAAAYALAASLRRGSAGLRHLVWSGGIVAVLVLPVASLLLPWRLPVARVPLPVPTAAGPQGDRSAASPGGAPAPVPAPAAAPISRPATSASPARSFWAGVVARPSAAQWLLWIWVAGAALVLLRLLRGALVVRRVLRGAEPLTAPDWQRPLVEAADRLGLAREPRLLVSDAVLMPLVCGVFAPAIVLPAEARGWTDRRRRAVLCHELAHVRRFDLGLTILSRVGCAVWWFHPLVWVAARRLRLESERACDDMVLGVGTRPSEYADHLLQIACGAGSMRSPAVALPMAERREFEGRMLAILEKGARRTPASARHAALLAGVGAAVVLPLAALGLAQAPAVPPAGSAARAAASPRPSGASLTSVSRTVTREEKHTVAHQVSAASRLEAMAALSDTQAGRRAEAARSLDQKGDTAAVAALARLLRSDASEDVRVAAAEALGRMEAKAGVPALGDALGDQSAKVRNTAAWALGQIEDRTSVPALARALSDRDDGVRETAVWALGQIEGPDAVVALAAALARDATVAVRRTAAWALGQIGDKSAVGPLGTALRGERDGEVRRTVAWALGQIGDGAAVPALSTGLSDPVEDVRLTCAWALGQIGPRGAPEALLRALGHDTPAVREKAAWALGQIGDDAAVPALAAAVADSSVGVRRTALWALGQLDSGAARTAIMGALRSDDPELRAAAARALGGGSSEPRPEPMPMPMPRPRPND